MTRSTCAISALFLLIELIERSREGTDSPPLAETTAEGTPFAFEPIEPLDPRVPEGVNLDDMERALIGRAIPASMAFLGLAFIFCTLLIAGVPPLSGFVAKFAVLSALLNPSGLGAGDGQPGTAQWALLALLIASGLASTIALSRTGIRYFWAPQERPAPRLRVIECVPIMLLLGVCIVLTAKGDAVLRYAQATAEALHRPGPYIEAVLSSRPVPAPSSGGIAP